MDARLTGRIINRLNAFIEQLTQERRSVAAPQVMDALHQEIHQIEQTLANRPTRPSRIVRKTKPLEPITEQQKIIDLAG